MNKVKFRPKARIIHTLGSEIIKDSFAAIIELVKNSYDADAKYVIIKFNKINDNKEREIIISDDGHGMTYEKVVDVWMTPGTNDKLHRTTSPDGRVLLGAKGIGRLAAARIGKKLRLETTDTANLTTVLNIDWAKFYKDEYLDNCEVEIEIQKLKKEPGTELIITDLEQEWFSDFSVYTALIKELRKLLSPVKTKKESFGIFIDMEDVGVEELEHFHGEIEPFPVLDYYDYKLSGNVYSNGKISLKFENGVVKNLPIIKIEELLDPKEIEIAFSDNKLSFGEISLDLRIFDRDPDSIDEFIKRSKLKDDDGKLLGKREAKRLIDELSGISLFRLGFRIRPYGDSGYDWLELDKDRVQNPALRIGSDQITGFIQIGDEKKSKLIEKSSREGLFEDQTFRDLVKVVKKCLSFLEEKRFDFRKTTGRGRTARDISNVINDFLNLEKLQGTISKKLEKEKTSPTVIKDVKNIIRNELDKKSKDYEKIQETLSLYQGQVTLGKIVGVLMHEGRKPVKYIDEQSPRILRWMQYLQKEKILVPEDAIFSKEEIIQRLNGLKDEASLLISLFRKVDPLAIRKRNISSNVIVEDLVSRTKLLFESDLKKNNIDVKYSDRKNCTIKGVESDVYITLTNLFDNSIYWLSLSKKSEKKITIDVSYETGDTIIDFLDNGPGIKDEFVDSLFEPGFSTKPRGTGLGLSIAGEAIVRNNGIIKLMSNKNGTYFRITLPKGN